MSPYTAVYGLDNPLVVTYRIEGTAVLASEDYLNGHQEVRNGPYQVLKLARIRSTRVAANRMVSRDRFPNESGRSKKVEPS